MESITKFQDLLEVGKQYKMDVLLDNMIGLENWLIEEKDRLEGELKTLKSLNLEDWIKEWYKIQNEKEEHERRYANHLKEERQKYKDCKRKIRESKEPISSELEKEWEYWEARKTWNTNLVDSDNEE